MKKLNYEAPSVELLEVLVEQGFAQSKVESGDFETPGEIEGEWQ